MSFKIPRLQPRLANAHKGNFGRALLIGGSKGMTGAISLSALGTLRCGAGLTTVATPNSCWSVVAALHPTLMTMPLPDDSHGRISGNAWHALAKVAAGYTAIAIGPGMGQSVSLQRFTQKAHRHLPCPLVVDADAINLLAQDKDWSKTTLTADRILTPHPGEFQRLTGISASSRTDQIECAKDLTHNEKLTIVLKGNQTAICHDGEVVFNATGNSKMAVGGSGDLLTGMILAFLCQGIDAFGASRLACHLHGLAGDLAASRLGCPSVLATDLLEDLPRAFQLLDAGESE